MINQLKNFLQQHNLLNENTTLVVGYSGGFDSCALLHMLQILKKEYKFKLCAAHLNHGWRGEASDNDENNCKLFCKKYEIPFYTEKLDTKTPKTETAARNARYAFFKRAAEHFQTKNILTAHTKSDNAETIIYRIAKGTGISGLCAINPTQSFKNLNIYRPILFASRSDIETYCKANKLSPNNDLSNFDTKYKRNLIRHEIIPSLNKINPNSENALNSLCQSAKNQEEIVQEYLKQIRTQIYIENKFITPKYLKLSKVLQERIIYDLIINLKIDYDRKKITEIADFINKNANSKSGKLHSIGKNLWLFCNYQYFEIITDLTQTKNSCSIKIKDLNKKYKFDNIIFSAEKIMEIPLKYPLETDKYAIVNLFGQKNLELRYRRPGDIIQPFGMQQPIKLKKYFINKGIAQHKKNKIVLLCNKNEILWACSVGISEKLRVKNTPTHIIKIEEAKNDN